MVLICMVLLIRLTDRSPSPDSTELDHDLLLRVDSLSPRPTDTSSPITGHPTMQIDFSSSVDVDEIIETKSQQLNRQDPDHRMKTDFKKTD